MKKEKPKSKTLRVTCNGRNVISPIVYEGGVPPLYADMMATALDSAEPGDALVLPCGKYRVKSVGRSEDECQVTKTVEMERTGDVPYGFQEAGAVDNRAIRNAVRALIALEKDDILHMSYDPAEDGNETSFELKKQHWLAALKSLQSRAEALFAVDGEG